MTSAHPVPAPNDVAERPVCWRGASSRLLLALIAVGVVLPMPSAMAEEQRAVRPVAEAWYRPLPSGIPGTAPLCVPMAGCVAVNPYPADTLHVGAAAGAEEARTYLRLDPEALPPGVRVIGGTLTLPVLADADSGTLNVETATMKVCLVNGVVQDGVEGSVGGAPTLDCNTSSPAVYRAASSDSPPAFTVDLAPLASALELGAPPIAVVPDVQPGATGAWHVAFARRTMEDAPQVAALLRLATSTPAVQVEPIVPDVSESKAPAPDFGELPGPFDAGSGPLAEVPLVPATVPFPAEEPELGPPALALPEQPVPTAVTAPGAFASFAYPGVFLLPLVFGAVVSWVGRAFTRDFAAGRT